MPPKMVVLRPLSPQIRSEEIPDFQEEQNSRPDTPSMSYGSSRSNSSSIITCELCGMSGNHCVCPNNSDQEACRVFTSEEWTRSPHGSPALLAPKLFPQGAGYRQSGRTIPWRRPTSKTSTSFFQGSDRGPESNSKISTSSRFDYSAGKQDQPCHSLHNSTLSRLVADPAIDSRNPADCLTSDSEAEDDEDYSEDDDEGDEDNDWSGQDSYLEAIILRAVGDDLPLAAHLIPILHRSLRLEVATNATEKLGSWRYGVIKSAQGDRASGDQISANYASESTNNPRKRRRREGSTNQNRKLEDFEEEDDDDDDDPREVKGMDEDTGPEGQPPLPRLACPFHKHDPAKYSIQHGNVEGSKKAEYRTCEGPGFKSMQRLKEHLKRKHYPVQCERCYRIFPGLDRAVCAEELQRHRQLAVSCERSPPSEKEGISEAQWANLDKKKSSGKSQATSRIDLWMQYWDILFPGIERPATPWYDNKISSRIRQPTSEDVRHFRTLFAPMLRLKVSQQHICFPEGSEDVMTARVEYLVYQAFSIYLGLSGSASTTNSSSSRSGQQSSVLGGSFQPVSTPRTSRGQSSLSDSRSTATQKQACSMNTSNSPAELPLASRSLPQTNRTSMAPPMAMQMISVQSFTPGTIQSSIPNEQVAQAGFHSAMTANFAGDPYVNNGLGDEDGHWPVAFNNTDPNFYGSQFTPNLNTASYVDIGETPNDQALLDPSDDNGHSLRARGFEEYQSTRNLRYNGASQ